MHTTTGCTLSWQVGPAGLTCQLEVGPPVSRPVDPEGLTGQRVDPEGLTLGRQVDP